MSTRARIGIVNADGTITSIYTQSDGYFSHHSPILENHYATEAKVRELLALGALSYLAENIGEKHDFNNPVEGWCRSYHRDRDELLAVSIHKDRRAFDLFGSRCGAEYLYLFNKGKWTAKPEGPGRYLGLLAAQLAEKITT